MLEQTIYENEDMEMDIQAMNEPHMACLFLLDTSASMAGMRIDSLNRAVNEFKMWTETDEQAKQCVDIAIVTFGGAVDIVQNFVPVSQMNPVNLTAGGGTPMGEGIDQAIDMVRTRSKLYHQMGTPDYKPWIFMITDGAPTDDITAARQRIQDMESKEKLGFWGVGVPGYDKEVVTSLTKRCLETEGLDFRGLFNWAAKSMVKISNSKVGENIQFDPLPDEVHVVPSDWQ